MKVLLYRYGSICEPDIIEGFKELGFEVSEMRSKARVSSDSVKELTQFLLEHPHDFVFSINFFPIVSEVCKIFGLPYLCWTVDSPVMELFSKSIQNTCNKIFIFDRQQYNDVHHLNPEGTFYFPLAVNVKDKQRVINEALESVKNGFVADISFVGSLYSEKNPYDKLSNHPAYLKGFLDGVMEAQLQVYGYYFVDELITDDIAQEFKKYHPSFYTPFESIGLSDAAILSQLYIGNKITAIERQRTMEILGKGFDVDLYTGSDTSQLPMVCNRGLANSLTEMPIIFHESRINLNTTSKSIRSGIPQRVFDIMSCGGFVLTNYQAELPELFDIGAELAAYSSMDEMCELASYYLTHEKERREIAQNGFEKVRDFYNYPKRLSEMLALAFDIV